jgi:hypothetical protein
MRWCDFRVSSRAVSEDRGFKYKFLQVYLPRIHWVRGTFLQAKDVLHTLRGCGEGVSLLISGSRRDEELTRK